MLKAAKCLLLLALAGALQAGVKPPSLISDHMVLEQGMPVRIWGTVGPGEAVRVDFQEQTISTKAGQTGKLAAWLEPLAARPVPGDDHCR